MCVCTYYIMVLCFCVRFCSTKTTLAIPFQCSNLSLNGCNFHAKSMYIMVNVCKCGQILCLRVFLTQGFLSGNGPFAMLFAFAQQCKGFLGPVAASLPVVRLHQCFGEIFHDSSTLANNQTCPRTRSQTHLGGVKDGQWCWVTTSSHAQNHNMFAFVRIFFQFNSFLVSFC